MIKIDYKIQSVQRGKFSRMAVRVNLNKSLISRFKIEDRIQMVDYEDLPVICYQCRCFGHVADTCDFHQTCCDKHTDKIMTFTAICKKIDQNNIL